MSETVPREWRCGEYVISDDLARFGAHAMHRFLEQEAYWARGRSPDQTVVAAANSLVLGVYAPDGPMVGGARIVTDRAGPDQLMRSVLDAYGLTRMTPAADASQEPPPKASVSQTIT